MEEILLYELENAAAESLHLSVIFFTDRVSHHHLGVFHLKKKNQYNRVTL